MWKILFLLFLISCADDTITNSEAEINPENLNIMTWNIQNFPKEDELTIGFVSEIINSLDVDIIALQEIESTSALTELTNNLDGNWISDRYGNSTWGELSYLINIDKIEITENPNAILENEDFYFASRPPYKLKFIYNNQEITLINVHLKCCGDGMIDETDEWDEEYRRLVGLNILENYISDEVSNENVIILGDFNDNLIDDENVFDIFLNKPQEYLFADFTIAKSSSNYWSWPGWGSAYPASHFDHILISNELFDEYQNEGSTCNTLLLEQNSAWSNYSNSVSDHRPVIISLKIN